MTAGGVIQGSGLLALRLVALPLLRPTLWIGAVLPGGGTAAVTLWGQARTIRSLGELLRLAAGGLLRRLGHEEPPRIGGTVGQARRSSAWAVLYACSGSEVRVDSLLDIHGKDAEAERADDLREEHDVGFPVAGVGGWHGAGLCSHYLALPKVFPDTGLVKTIDQALLWRGK